MSLIRYEPRYRPFNMVNRLHEDLDHLFRIGLQEDDETVADWLPSVDIKEEHERFIVHADLPGVDPDAIDVTMENGVLTVQGERSAQSEEDKDGYRRVERVTGRFHRRFSLPDTADASAISAENRNGVLEIVIPKREEVKPQRIAVKVC